jgi:hypothetical protein
MRNGLAQNNYCSINQDKHKKSFLNLPFIKDLYRSLMKGEGGVGASRPPTHVLRSPGSNYAWIIFRKTFFLPKGPGPENSPPADLAGGILWDHRSSIKKKFSLFWWISEQNKENVEALSASPFRRNYFTCPSLQECRGEGK